MSAQAKANPVHRWSNSRTQFELAEAVRMRELIDVSTPGLARIREWNAYLRNGCDAGPISLAKDTKYKEIPA